VVILALALATLLQESSVKSKEADDLRGRAVVECDGGRAKVTVDGTLLYEGAGAKAKVDVIEIAAFPGRRFVTVAVDEEERVRVLAAALSPVAKLPGADPNLADDVFARVSTEDESMTIHMVRRSTGEAREVFRGPVSLGKPELHGRGDTIELKLAGHVIFRTRRAKAVVKTATVGDFVERLNVHRKAAGLAEVEARPELSRACDLHALYLAKNAGRDEVKGLKAHDEVAGLPGATEEGARAGKQSVIHYFGARQELARSVDSLMATLYHRVQMLEPRLSATGAGWAFDAEGASIVVLHMGTLAGRDRDEPVVYPGPDQKDVPLEFALGGRETPDPVPDLKAQGGYPVTVQFAWAPVEPSMRLLCEGKPVDAWVSTPANPARADFLQGRTMCLIAKKPLEAGKTYTVEARAKKGAEAWERTWKFVTKK
jgi:hypothetical protein